MSTTKKIAAYEDVSELWQECDPCPVHGGRVKKLYTFGSTLSAETDVTVFHGCRCAVAECHSPIGSPSRAVYHETYDSAAGQGRLRAMEAAAKYR